MHRLAADAVAAILQTGEQLHLVPQNVYEFWVVATRPVSQNGLGLTTPEVQAEIARFKTLFTIIDDTPAIFHAWEQIVAQHQVTGKNAHDARLVAAMSVHGIGRILTFNKPDFSRYQAIVALSPHDVLGLSATP
jgi:predicted nucleic acid-binding protein